MSDPMAVGRAKALAEARAVRDRALAEVHDLRDELAKARRESGVTALTIRDLRRELALLHTQVRQGYQPGIERQGLWRLLRDVSGASEAGHAYVVGVLADVPTDVRARLHEDYMKRAHVALVSARDHHAAQPR